MIKEVIFVVDPMYSWCWGFSPTIESLGLNNHFKCSIVLGGLRGKGDMTWDEDSKRYIEGHMVCQKGYRCLEQMNNLLKGYNA